MTARPRIPSSHSDAIKRAIGCRKRKAQTPMTRPTPRTTKPRYSTRPPYPLGQSIERSGHGRCATTERPPATATKAPAATNKIACAPRTQRETAIHTALRTSISLKQSTVRRYAQEGRARMRLDASPGLPTLRELRRRGPAVIGHVLEYKKAPRGARNKREIPGNDLLSHPVARAVPSALVGLTAVFGMGTGVSPPL